jgi:8-oxo-dGTP pyrophosphatase MutT (NUDIX family)
MARAAGVKLSARQLADLTRRRLTAYERRIVPLGELVQAAVLVPILGPGPARLAFAQRSQQVLHHRGQIGFPGGVVKPGDGGFLAAALRESEEEIGLLPDAVEPIGLLDDVETVATHFVITPCVGLVQERQAWRPDGNEIERIIEIPFADLANPGNFRVEMQNRDGLPRPVYFFECQGEVIWGATARVVKHLLELLTGRSWGP